MVGQDSKNAPSSPSLWLTVGGLTNFGTSFPAKMSAMDAISGSHYKSHLYVRKPFTVLGLPPTSSVGG
jgi:hypothetical protein